MLYCMRPAGILASFYNPEEPGVETLALFVKPTQLADTAALGSAQVRAPCSGAGPLAPAGQGRGLLARRSRGCMAKPKAEV